jgi:hypothetical protein
VGLEAQVINMSIDLLNNGVKPNKTEEIVNNSITEDYVKAFQKASDEAVSSDSSKWFDSHYSGKVQPIELMQSAFSKDEFAGFLRGNIIKYATRLGKKDMPISEAEKILRYSQWLVQHLKGETIDPRK